MDDEGREAFGRHLEKFGLKYSDGPHLNANGGGIAFVDAPEGYEIETAGSKPSILA